MNNIVTMNTSEFSYNKNSFTFRGIADRFPREIDLVSAKTGQIVRFVQDVEAAINAEFWDGEMMEYMTKQTDVNRLRIVLTHGF